MEKIYCVIFGRYRKFKNPKISYVFEKKHKFFLLFVLSVAIKMTKFLKRKNLLRC